MQRKVVVVLLVCAAAIYVLRCVTYRSHEELLVCISNATRQVQQHLRGAAADIRDVQVTVLATPSGRSLQNADVECGFYKPGIAPVSARTNDVGSARIAIPSEQVGLGEPIRVRLTDAQGRRAFYGTVLLDKEIVLTVPDLGTVEVVQAEQGRQYSWAAALYADPIGGVSVPQFIDKYDIGGSASSHVTGYWRGANKLHYVAVLGSGRLTGRVLLDEAGSGTIRLPHPDRQLVIRVASPDGVLVGAEVQVEVTADDVTYTATSSTDSNGKSELVVWWGDHHAGIVRVTCAHYASHSQSLQASELPGEVVCRLERGEEATREETQTSEASFAEETGGRVATSLNGCCVLVAPYGMTRNPLYSALPVRYLLYDLETGRYSISHGHAQHALLSVKSGTYCLHVMVGKCVAYGRAIVRIGNERSLEVAVPCIDPGEFRIRVRGGSPVAVPLLIAAGIPSDILSRWGGSHAIMLDGSDAVISICAFGLQQAVVKMGSHGGYHELCVDVNRDSEVNLGALGR